jgi:hypothetical protein
MGRGCAKTRSPMSVAQRSAHSDLVLIRKTQHANRRQHDIAHCRYGTTFSHSLGRSSHPAKGLWTAASGGGTTYSLERKMQEYSGRFGLGTSAQVSVPSSGSHALLAAIASTFGQITLNTSDDALGGSMVGDVAPRHDTVRSHARCHALLSSIFLSNCSTNRLPRSAASTGVRYDHSAPRARIATQRVSSPTRRCSTW